MSIFIASFILLIIASAYAVLLSRKLAETFFLSAVTIVGVLYCFSLLNIRGCLLYGIYFIAILAIVCAIFLIHTFIKNKKIFWETEILQGGLIYTCILAFSLFINFGRTFQSWDEFSHWGFIVKHFYSVDALGTFKNPNYDILFPAYFPGTSLFQYFYTRFSNQFKEYYSFIAMNLLYFSMVMPFIKDIFDKKNCVKSLCILVIFSLLPFISISFFYSEVTVDTILGAFFGFSLLYYFIYKYEESVYGILMVSAATFMLTITKDMGLLFSLGVIGIIALDTILFKRAQFKSLLNRRSGLKYKLKVSALMLIPLISTLFVKLSWSILLERTNIKSIWYIPTLKDIYMLLTKQVARYQKDTALTFVHDAMWNRKIPNINLSVTSFSLIFIIVILIVALLNQEKFNFRRIITSALSLLAGLYIYQFVLMLMYVFSFSEYEAMQLASYERYTSSYLIGMIFFVMTFYISPQSEFKMIDFLKIKELANSSEFIKYKDVFKFIKISVYLFVTIGLLMNIFINSKEVIAKTMLNRIVSQESFKPRPTAISAEKWKSYFKDTNPYFIAEGDNGFLYFRMRYELIPYSKLANITWDYSVAPVKHDIWAFAISPEEWEKYVLSNYKLIYLYKSNEEFVANYGRYFPYGVKEDMVYRAQNNHGHLLLTPVVEIIEK